MKLVPQSIAMEPIGVIRTPFGDKASAPRQAVVAAEAAGVVELFPDRGFEDALEGLETFDRVWLLFAFHEATGWKPKVLPPRSTVKRGLFATRSPHRPSPIGLSAVKLERIEGLNVHVRGVDMVDGTPVLDIKPYVPYADAFPDASSGWLSAPEDPGPTWDIAWSDRAKEQAAWLAEHYGLDLVVPAHTLLSTGPEPHAYRRIRRLSDKESVLAMKSWRLHFTVEGRKVTVLNIATGYRPSQLANESGEEIQVHRAYVAHFDPKGDQ